MTTRVAGRCLVLGLWVIGMLACEAREQVAPDDAGHAPSDAHTVDAGRPNDAADGSLDAGARDAAHDGCDDRGSDRDALCGEDEHCDEGACNPDLADGSACDEASDCESQHCENGLCCEDGACCNDAADCPGVDGIGAVCDDASTCQGTRGALVCSAHRCGTESGVPDDSACNASVVAASCGFARDVTCNGELEQSAPACGPAACASDADCDEDAHCEGECAADMPDGTACDEPSDCVSAHCQNGFCCASGDCCQATFDCPESYSAAPFCELPSECHGAMRVASCEASRCESLRLPDDSGCVPGTPVLECGLARPVECTGESAQPPPRCPTSCTSDVDCVDGAHCDDVCTTNALDGEICDEASDCASGHCQNGFCCASGDCCAVHEDCNAPYATPPTCASPSSCQGSRTEGVCGVDHVCSASAPISDDSGCDGVVADECGLFPAVTCSAATEQPSDPARACDTACSADTECDPGAFCRSGACISRGMAGDACTATPECSGGLSCVDGVCCTSSCEGTCMACNVAGHRGTCSPVPVGVDPANECGALSCDGWYFGWRGRGCYGRSDAPAYAVDCDGAGACETAADVCAYTPARSDPTTTCDATCGYIWPGTCEGAREPYCPPRDLGGEWCGVGACRHFRSFCVSGRPNAETVCTPGRPVHEVCNFVDDDCNGTIDDLRTPTEPNNDCPGTPYVVLTSSGWLNRGPFHIMPSTERDVYQLTYLEDDDFCSCFDGRDEDYSASVRLWVGAGSPRLRLCGTADACDPHDRSHCVEAGAGELSAWVHSWHDGRCGASDHGTSWFYVEQVDPSVPHTCDASGDYTIDVYTLPGCF